MDGGLPVEPRLVFTDIFDQQTAWEAEQKGWFQAAVVELPDGSQVPVSFWDPVRLAQDLAADVEAGQFCLAEPGMIVVPKVTLANMIGAIRQLSEDGYFERLLALGSRSNDAIE